MTPSSFRGRLAATSALAALAAGVLGLPAAAQVVAPGPNSDAQSAAPGEIVVTAQKRSENIQTVPLQVTAVAANVLQANEITNAQSLDQVVPDLTFKQGNTNLNSTVAIRGIGTQSFSPGAEPSVSVVVDGVVYGRPGMAFQEFTDLDHVEVLAGPQSTLFGKGASAGVVNIVTKRPTATVAGDVTAGYFTDGEWRGTAFASGPLNATNSFVISAVYDTWDGNAKNLFNGKTVNGFTRGGVRGKLISDLSPDLRFTLEADYTHAHDDCCADILGNYVPNAQLTNVFIPELGFNPHFGNLTINNDLDPLTLDTNSGLSGTFDWKLGGGFTLTSISAYRNWQNTQLRDGDYHSGCCRYVASMDIIEHDRGNLNYNQFSEELRLASPATGRLQWLAGAFFWHTEDKEDFARSVQQCTASTLPADATTFRPCAPGLSTFLTNTGPAIYGAFFNNEALYGQGTYNLTSRLRLIGGLRYTWDRVSYYINRMEAVSGVPGITTSYANSSQTDDSAWSGKAGLQYDLAPHAMAYATYSHGYKGPAFNVFYNMTALNAAPIAPETNDAYEVGFKSELFDRTLTLDADVFVENILNFQANNFITVNGSVTTNLTNAGNVRSEGLEVNFAWRPVRDLVFSGGYIYDDAYIVAQYCSATLSAANLATCRAPDNKQLPFAPRDKLSVTGDWRVPIPDSLPFNLRLVSTYSYQTQTNFDIAQTPLARQPAYGLWNANITGSTKDGRYDLALIFKNITDQYYTTFITPAGNGIAPGSYTRLQVPQDAQFYMGVELRAHF